MSRTKNITLGYGSGAGPRIGSHGNGFCDYDSGPCPSVSASADGTSPTDGKGMRDGHGDRGQLDADLATKLGLDEANVTSALQAFRDANKPATGDGTRPNRSAMDAALAKSLAEALGVEESKVTAALEEIRTADALEEIRTPDQERPAAALKIKLVSAVTDGTLTQTEADAVTKAAETGVIGAGR